MTVTINTEGLWLIGWCTLFVCFTLGTVITNLNK